MRLRPVPGLAREALQGAFGSEEFLEGQAEIMEEILASRDGLVMMPTGGEIALLPAPGPVDGGRHHSRRQRPTLLRQTFPQKPPTLRRRHHH